MLTRMKTFLSCLWKDKSLHDLTEVQWSSWSLSSCSVLMWVCFLTYMCSCGEMWCLSREEGFPLLRTPRMRTFMMAVATTDSFLALGTLMPFLWLAKTLIQMNAAEIRLWAICIITLNSVPTFKATSAIFFELMPTPVKFFALCVSVI